MNSPRPMRFTDRDARILEAIHAFDGMMGAQQVQRLFFDSWRTTRERLSKLYQNGYIARPDRRQRAALTQQVYWLTENGARIVAGLHGQELNEFHWRNHEPRWSMVEHDLSVNDFRMAVMLACNGISESKLEEWIPQGEFWAHPDEVEYRDEHGRTVKRRVRPDGFFMVCHWHEDNGGWYHHRMLLELDRATEDNPRFAREKVRPGVAYLNSRSYAQRFGIKSGRWLVVTTSERRMQNMKRQTELAAGEKAPLFYFTVINLVRPETVLTEPIWWRGGDEQPKTLFDIF